MSDLDAAAASLEESVAIYRELGNRTGVAHGLIWLADVAIDRGDFPKAHALAGESLTLCQQGADPWGMAWSLYYLHRYAEALVLFREIGDRTGIAIALTGLGCLAESQGDYTLARTHFQEALTLFQQLDDQLNTAMELASLGIVTLHQRGYRTAATFFADSLRRARKIHAKLVIDASLVGSATVASAWEEPVRAAQLLGAAEALC